MSWTLLLGVILALGSFALIAALRRAELARMEHWIRLRDRAVRHGSTRAQLQQPEIDLARCMGCGTCVVACPEERVLELVHGQAQVVNGASCQGISKCASECPVGAITVTLLDLEERRDIPALTEDLEAPGSPGLFLAGEVTARARIKTAIDHGTAVVGEITRRLRETDTGGLVAQAAEEGALDLCIVGTGPAGLAASLEARRQGLSFVTLERESGPGGTVAKYPRSKLVVSQKIELPLHGTLNQDVYSREQLVELWTELAERHDLPIAYNREIESVERSPEGLYRVRSSGGDVLAKHVCIAVGRRGTPRRLGVPGEELVKVSYGLLDARSYGNQRVLVVGGGDSAAEAALALAEQEGTEVVISYRKAEFFRLRPRNEERLQASIACGSIRALTRSEVLSIGEQSVELRLFGERETTLELPNDHVFIFAGGTPPFSMLERAGISFDPAHRPAPPAVQDRGGGLRKALAIAFGLSLLTALWSLVHADYYMLTAEARPVHPKHDWLRPGNGWGLAMGVLATVLISVNLCYLLRRSTHFKLSWGSLQAWMSSHVATGVLAFLCATIHSAMSVRDTSGGHAYMALGILLVTGGIGRYFYALVPRAANGRELELAEAKQRLRRLGEEWEGVERRFAHEARDEALALIEKRQWRGHFIGRVLSLCGVRLDLSRLITRLSRRAAEQGLRPEDIGQTMQLVREGYWRALMAAHYEDLRSIMHVWRYLHRWATALMLLLLAGHVVYAIAFSAPSYGALSMEFPS